MYQVMPGDRPPAAALVGTPVQGQDVPFSGWARATVAGPTLRAAPIQVVDAAGSASPSLPYADSPRRAGSALGYGRVAGVAIVRRQKAGRRA